MKHGLRFRKNTDFRLDCYVDANFSDLWHIEDDQEPVCVKSRTGYVMMLHRCPVHWVSKLQDLVICSTTESEFVALSMAMKDLLPMQAFLEELKETMPVIGDAKAVVNSTVFEDDNEALHMATSPKMTPRTKWIAIKYHFFKDHIGVEKGIILKKISSDLQVGDIFTKYLDATC